jgi:predicted nuclease of predicted toxin-antitoxin system
MRVLVDEQLDGMVPLLRSKGFDCISVKKEHPGLEDEKLVAMAQQNNWVFITEDVGAAEIARFHGANLIQIDMVLKAKGVEAELREIQTKGLVN